MLVTRRPAIHWLICSAATLMAAMSLAVTGVASASARTAATSFSFTSAAGDYIGGGLSESFTPEDAAFTLYQGSYEDPATRHGLTVYVNATNGEWWYISIAPAQGQLLKRGTFTATRWPFQEGANAGFDASGDGRGCNTSYSTFTIAQLTVRGGAITRLDATFTQHCESPTAPPMTGRVEVNATR